MESGLFLWLNVFIAGLVVFAAWRLLAGSAGLSLLSRLLILAVILQAWGLNFLPRPKQQVIDNFHRLYYDANDTWRQSKWLGVVTLQNPNDVWIHQEIISELKPDLIVECGTEHGGSALIWAMILDQVNPQGRVLTIDIVDNVKEAAENPLFRSKVDRLIGSSTDAKIVEEVKKRAEGKNVLVILDSDHRKDHVLRELRAYSSLVPVGGYVIVQDTNINGHPVFKEYGPGPWEAVDAFLAENDSFEPDRTRENLLFTMHPRGYLQRKK